MISTNNAESLLPSTSACVRPRTTTGADDAIRYIGKGFLFARPLPADDLAQWALGPAVQRQAG